MIGVEKLIIAVAKALTMVVTSFLAPSAKKI